MFAFDRETATIVAVVVCIAATFYLYREIKRTKEELNSVIAAKQWQVGPTLAPVTAPDPAPAPALAPVPAPAPAAEPVTESKK